MEPSERYGIPARFAGKCGLCGADVSPGERIYHLPASRRGTQKKWVCAPCRWPDKDRVIDLPFIVRKATHRMDHGPSYTPTHAEMDLIIEAMDGLHELSPDEETVLVMFEDYMDRDRSPTLGRAKISVLLGALARAHDADS